MRAKYRFRSQNVAPDVPGVENRNRPPPVVCRRRVFLPVLSVAMAMLLGGCGNKGPLYLPEPDAGRDSAKERKRRKQDGQEG